MSEARRGDKATGTVCVCVVGAVPRVSRHSQQQRCLIPRINAMSPDSRPPVQCGGFCPPYTVLSNDTGSQWGALDLAVCPVMLLVASLMRNTESADDRPVPALACPGTGAAEEVSRPAPVGYAIYWAKVASTVKYPTVVGLVGF